MSTVCKQAISMFTAMEEFFPSSVTEVHKCLEQELSNDTVRWICDIVSESVDVQKRKYGTSALLMGPLGYYHPSRINELTSTNVRRGRISRNMPSSYTFVYDYNETGAVIRITNVHACTVTYILHQEMCDICISVQQGTNEIEHIMIIQYDADARPRRWMQLFGHNRMRAVDAVAIEVYRDTPSGSMCTKIDGISDDDCTFRGLCFQDYSLSCDKNGKVIAARLLS